MFDLTYVCADNRSEIGISDSKIAILVVLFGLPSHERRSGCRFCSRPQNRSSSLTGVEAKLKVISESIGCGLEGR